MTIRFKSSHPIEGRFDLQEFDSKCGEWIFILTMRRRGRNYSGNQTQNLL